ncbi:unannotated protein [freshwater metagenome]|uniref:Unannotated protein n=1 Tax=freshwater metagenome TaxID=449393 RepID=A0A6J7J4E9_9ZZZZ|nr:hypothetical protein [Actinomycetota bacterium]
MELGTEAQGLRASRRNVVRGAAWSVPVIAVATAAPAFAASPCDVNSYTLDWSGGTSASGLTSYTPPTNPAGSGVKVGTATVAPPSGSLGSVMTVTFSSRMIGSMVRASDNLTLSAEQNVGGLGLGPGLNVSHADGIPSGYANRQELSISFTREVTGLQFTITDIDALSGGWIDQIAVSGTRTGTPVATVQGTGATDNPWMPTVYGNRPNNASGGNVSVAFTAPIPANTPIVISFWNMTNGGDGNQRVFLSDMTFNAKGC